MAMTRLLLSFTATAAVCATSHAQIWGIKSTAVAGSSGAPANLFQLNADGSGFVDHGAIRVAGATIDADGLAGSSVYGLVAYQLTGQGSTLVRIDPTGAVATPIGGTLAGRDIRGAAFDLMDRLWVLDSTARSIFRVDPASGAVVAGSEVSLSLTTGAFPDLQDSGDIAITASGQMTLVAVNQVFSVDPSTGLATLLGTDPATAPINFLVGAAYSPTGPADRLFAFEVNNSDDIVYYDTRDSIVPHSVLADIIPGFNSGRGDLAVIPVPASLMILGAGLVGTRRRR